MVEKRVTGVVQHAKTEQGVPVTPPTPLPETIVELLVKNASPERTDFINIDRVNGRAEAVIQCLEKFFTTIIQKKDDPAVLAIRIAAVGLRIQGRASRYDLYYLPKSGKRYAVCEHTDQVFPFE